MSDMPEPLAKVLAHLKERRFAVTNEQRFPVISSINE